MKTFNMISCLTLLTVISTERPISLCEKDQCDAGGCVYEKCRNPITCNGGGCEFRECIGASCSGGGCVFYSSKDSICNGGGCRFYSMQSTLKTGYCQGGGCTLDDQVWPSRFNDRMAI